MNNSQFLSLVRWLLNAVSGGIIAYTAAKSPAAQTAGAYVAQLITGPDVVSAGVLGVTWLWGHLTHASTSSPSSASGGVPKAGGVALLAALCAASFLFTGCASTPQQAAYKAAGATDVTVQAALAAYDQFAKAGKTTPAQNAAVAAAFQKYQAAFALVCDAGAVYSASSVTNGQASSAALQTAIANANQTITDLVALVQSFGVKL